MGKCKNATRGGQMFKQAPLSLCHLIEVKQVTQMRQFMIWGMMWIHWRKEYHKWVLFQMPFRFMQSFWSPSECSLMPEHWQHHPTCKDQMPYCIHVRVTRGRERWPGPTFQCKEWIINCGYVPRGSWRVDYQSCSPCPWGGSHILWMTITEGRALLGKCQGFRIQLDGPHQLGWYDSSGRGNCIYCIGRSLRYCRCCCGKEN